MYGKTLAAVTLAISLPLLAADGTAKGTVAYKKDTVTIKHVWLVKGPDAVDPKVTIRKLIFSAADIGAIRRRAWRESSPSTTRRPGAARSTSISTRRCWRS
jgi:hypothetical protein